MLTPFKNIELTSRSSYVDVIAILLLLKCGIFTSIEASQLQGKETVKQYYAKHLDQETINDIFTA